MTYLRKTKIVCTMGPACDDEEKLRALIQGGMNVARFNFSHGSHAEHKKRMDAVKRISKELDMPVALMLDTKGPEIRTGLVEDGGTASFNRGDHVVVDSEGGWTIPSRNAESGHISLSLKGAASLIKAGVKILIADGLLELDVLESDGKKILCRAANSAKIGSRKNVNLIGFHAGLPIIGEQDKEDISFGAGEDIDFIAASFVSFPQEINEIRVFLRKIKCSAKIIAKIENGEGLDNIEEIALLADGIMAARGDLAVQIPDEYVPLAQKKIIAAARRQCKPVIIATQMLDSMIVNPRPTRAELTDVANAIFDGADAVMLSGETAQGAYPVEAAATLDKIACAVEQSCEFSESRRAANAGIFDIKAPEAKKDRAIHFTDISAATARSAYETACFLKAKLILTPTITGGTARQISRFRPAQPIIAVTPEERALKTMLLNWGVMPKLTKKAANSDEMIQNAIKICSEEGLAGISDTIVIAAGLPIGSPLPLNTVRVHLVGNVLARSSSGGFANNEAVRASGRIVWADSAARAREVIKADGGDILVCPSLTDEYTPILRIVRGVICEGVCHIHSSILGIINPNLVWLSGVTNASRKLESGLFVTIDSEALLVYEGSV